MIVPAIPQFIAPTVPADLDAKQTQFVASTLAEAKVAAEMALHAYGSGDPPAGVWYPNPDQQGDLTWTPASTLV